MTHQVVMTGRGLHTGAPSRVVFRARPGPVRLATTDAEATLDDLAVVSTARATTVQSRDGRIRIGTIEHALAALAGMGVREGLTVSVEGPEMPLLDGGALAYCRALAALSLARGLPFLRVARTATFEVGPSRFEFAPGEGVDVSVHVELEGRPSAEARWQGEPDDFVARIAPARTFALLRDVDELIQRGLARHVDPESVVVIGAGAVHHAGPAFLPDEPARHKLLDWLGDWYLRGGPPIGRVHAFRPGHAPNARVIERALREGVIVRACGLPAVL